MRILIRISRFILIRLLFHLFASSFSCIVLGDLYPQPYNGQVRLVGGEFPSQGRLEVYFNGQWGAVCGEGTLDANVATTVCTQLGYSVGSVQAVR